MEKQRRKKYVNNEQMKLLVEMVAAKYNTITSRNNTEKRASLKEQAWHKIKEECDKLGPPTKTIAQWKKVWFDTKTKLINSNRTEAGTNNIELLLQELNKLKNNRTETGPSNCVNELTPLKDQIIEVCVDDIDPLLEAALLNEQNKRLSKEDNGLKFKDEILEAAILNEENIRSETDNNRPTFKDEFLEKKNYKLDLEIYEAKLRIYKLEQELKVAPSTKQNSYNRTETGPSNCVNELTPLKDQIIEVCVDDIDPLLEAALLNEQNKRLSKEDNGLKFKDEILEAAILNEENIRSETDNNRPTFKDEFLEKKTYKLDLEIYEAKLRIYKLEQELRVAPSVHTKDIQQIQSTHCKKELILD